MSSTKTLNAVSRPGNGVPRRGPARTAADYLPARQTLPALQRAAEGCQGCELFHLVKPHTIVCLGATAAQAILGRAFRITQHRGELLPCDWATCVLPTWHPSALLRAPEEEDRRQMRDEFFADLKRAVRTAARKESIEQVDASSRKA